MKLKAKTECSSKFQMAVYQSRMTPIGQKLWQNAFHAICNFLCFNADKYLGFFCCWGRLVFCFSCVWEKL